MKKYIYILLILSAFSSCNEDLLEKESSSQVTAKQAFENEKTIEAIRVGMYAEIAYKAEGALYTLKLPVLGDILGNDMVYGSQWYQSWNSEYAYKTIPRSPGPLGLWTGLYYMAEITNTVTSKLEKGSEKIKNAVTLRSEAKALRGMIHTDVARFFGKAYHLDNGESKAIPYINTLQYDPANPGVIKKPSRNTMKEIYQLAIKDIAEAIPNLPDLKGNENIMNKNAAHAILSRIYLDMHKYSDAKKHAEKALDGVSLMSPEEYLRGDLSRVNSESILCFSSDKDKYSKWRTITSFFDNWDGMGDDFLANTTLVALFEKDDLRRKFFVPEFYSGYYKYWEDFLTKPDVGFYVATKANPNGCYTYGKMPRKDSDFLTKTRGTLGLGEYNYIRGAEMILTIAECNARLGNNAAAQLELLKIQKRANKNAKQSVKTGNELIEEVLLERRKELFGEGHSFRDILRIGKGLHRDGSHPVKVSLDANDTRFVWPIPKEATDRNPNLKK